MKTTKVLLIEGPRNNGVSFATSLKRKYLLQVAYSGKQGLTVAAEKRPDLVILDAASLRTSGDRICSRLRIILGETTPIIHIRSEAALPDVSQASLVLTPPFTARKLINRIERFIVPPMGNVLEMGPFSLNLEQQTLTTPWVEKKLTPKLMDLMELFMRNLNQTLDRKQIIQAVWKTDYMGDTRTLDVHIRWIRKIVEPNPRKPRFITTVRGVGYCFTLADPSTETEPADQSAEPEPETL
ncbi:MAG: response regulator transcription factor [Chloroflexi bacterium]|nr:response regulator transcription factor [Chloroflexota bacterium]